MTTYDEQDAFERAMGGPPEHCIRVGGGYASTEYGAWRAHEYVQQWAGWKARAAIAALDAEPLEDVLKEAAALGREGVSISYSDDASWGPWYAVIAYDAFSFDEGQGESAAEAVRNAVAAAQEGV